MNNDSKNISDLSPISIDLLIEIASLCISDCTEISLLSLSVNNPRVFGIISDFTNLVNYTRQGGKL